MVVVFAFVRLCESWHLCSVCESEGAHLKRGGGEAEARQEEDLGWCGQGSRSEANLMGICIF
jgi:hypothetical protein